MKIQGTGPTQGASKTGKKDKVSDSDTDFSDFFTSGPTSAAPTKATQSIAHVDALLMLQGAEDPAQQSSRKRMRQRADVILNELEKIRTGMLSGTLTVGHMIDVADVVASHREKIADPALMAIMDEVDLRAQVELAKMRVALDKARG